MGRTLRKSSTNEILWGDKKRLFGKDKFGSIPASFTEYKLIKSDSGETKLTVKTGILSTRTDNIYLYHILDIAMNRTLFDRIFKTGSIHIESVDKSCPELTLQHILEPEEVMDLLSDLISKEKRKNNQQGREMFGVYDED